MRKLLKLSICSLLVSILVIFSPSLSVAQLSSYASLPYGTGFESGSTDANWYFTSNTAFGRIQIWNSSTLIWSVDTAKAHSGIYFLGMDVVPPGPNYTINEAWMGMNLLGQTGVRLSFWWSEWNDETEAYDGIFISDNGGSSFVKVLDLDGASHTDLLWTFFDLNLDSINSLYALNFTSTYVIKFQQYDNYNLAGGNDGFLFDDILVNNGCLNTFYSFNPSACISYTVPSGNATYTVSGTYYDTIPNTAGCDSLLTINLTVYPVETGVTLNGATLTSSASPAIYQWLDCDNSMAPVAGEVSQSFSPAANGNFAVQVTQGTCIDTSSCYPVLTVGTGHPEALSEVVVYPNPSTGVFLIETPKEGAQPLMFLLRDVHGRIIMSDNLPGGHQELDLSLLDDGVYFLTLMEEGVQRNFKLLLSK